MNLKHVLPVILLFALIVGGCDLQHPTRQTVDKEFTLKTAMADGQMVFIGVGGEIDGVINPSLTVRQGETVRIVLVNDDGMLHDLAIPDLNAQTSMTTSKGQNANVVFEVHRWGEYVYYCTVSGHRQAGMEGKLIVSE
jgi:nitrite reductase (NO-forming)